MRLLRWKSQDFNKLWTRSCRAQLQGFELKKGREATPPTRMPAEAALQTKCQLAVQLVGHIGSEEPGKLLKLPTHHAAAPHRDVQSSQVAFHVVPMAKRVHGLCELPCGECWRICRVRPVRRPHLDGDGNAPDASDVSHFREGLDDVSAVSSDCIEVKASPCTVHMSANSL